MSRGTSLIRKPRVVFLLVSLAALLFSLSYLLGKLQRSASAGTRQTSTAKVEKKQFSRTLRLNGTTQATRSFVVIAPRLQGAQVGTLIITAIAPSGSHVHQGDRLVDFDPQSQTRDYLEKKTSFDTLVGQVATKQAELDIARAKDDTALQAAEDELKRAQLEVQRNEIVSRIDAEKNQEALDEAQTTLKQLKETYQLKRAAALAALRILEIQRDRAQESMRYAQSNASKMSIHSPMDGVVVYNSIWLGGHMGTVQVGDQVRPGVPFLQVVDPSQMEVRVELNQVDLLRVHEGQHATMHLDAYPGLVLPALLEDMSPMGHNGQFSDAVKVFTTRFSVQGTDQRLLPDLSAALDVDLGSENSSLVIPSDAVAIEDGKPFVWLQTSAGFDKRMIHLGPRNDMEAVVVSGLSEGDIVRHPAQEENLPLTKP